MKAKYYQSAIAAFTIWGLFSLPLKAVANYSSFEILIYRVFFASLLIIACNLLFRKKQTMHNLKIFNRFDGHEKRKTILLNVISAALLALNWYLFIYVMNHISVNATSLSYLICPILTTVLATLFLRERLSALQWIAVGVSFLSYIFLSIGHFTDLVYSLVIALSYAIYLVLQKRNNQLDKFFTLSFQIIIGSILVIPLYYLSGQQPQEKTVFFYIILMLIAIVFTIIPMYLNVYALKGLNSSVVGIFIYINPILSFLLAIFYFDENINWLQGISYGLIFLSLFLFNSSMIQTYLSKEKRSLTKNLGDSN